MLVSGPDGQITWPSEKGLYFFDTRVISSWHIYANGEPWDLLNSGEIAYFASRTYLTDRQIPTADGIIAPRTLGLILSRLISCVCMKISTLPTTRWPQSDWKWARAILRPT